MQLLGQSPCSSKQLLTLLGRQATNDLKAQEVGVVYTGRCSQSTGGQSPPCLQGLFCWSCQGLIRLIFVVVVEETSVAQPCS